MSEHNEAWRMTCAAGEIAERNATIARLEAEVERLFKAGQVLMKSKHAAQAAEKKWFDQAQLASGKVRELREALKPFAEAAKRIEYYEPHRANENHPLYMVVPNLTLYELLDGIEGVPVTTAHLRAARYLLEQS